MIKDNLKVSSLAHNNVKKLPHDYLPQIKLSITLIFNWRSMLNQTNLTV